MSSATAGLAEAYVMKKLYKEQLKKMEIATGGKREAVNKGGRFAKMFKKAVHPTAVMPPSDTAAVKC